MDYIRRGRARHIIRKFSSADTDDRFKQLLRLCVMNVETFSEDDVHRLLPCLYPYWDLGKAENEVMWLFFRLSSARNSACGALLAINNFTKNLLCEQNIQYNVIFRPACLKRVVTLFRHVFIHFTVGITSQTEVLSNQGISVGVFSKLVVFFLQHAICVCIHRKDRRTNTCFDHTFKNIITF